MAKFLISIQNPLPEKLTELILSLPPTRKSFNPFLDNEFEFIFDKFIKNYKDKIPNYYNKKSKLKSKFKIYIDKGKSNKLYIGEADDMSITFFKGFFKASKSTKVRYVAHEITHCIQYMFERGYPGRPAKGRTVTNYKDDYYINNDAYYNDRYEQETIGRDLFYDIVWKRERGMLRQKKAVARWLRNHHDFNQLNPKNKKRMFRKILTNVFYH